MANVLTFTVDTTDEAQVADAFGKIEEKWGEVNALVNAVGPSGWGRFDDLTDDAWMRTFDQDAAGRSVSVRPRPWASRPTTTSALTPASRRSRTTLPADRF